MHPGDAFGAPDAGVRLYIKKEVHHMEWNKENYKVSTNKSLFDLSIIHQFLSEEAYWSKGVPQEVMIRAIENSLCFGLFVNASQIGFARLVTDKATFAYLADVFIVPEFRGKGLSKWLMSCIKEHPDLQGLRRMALVTADAHNLYSQFGFKPISNPDRFMEINIPDIYQQ